MTAENRNPVASAFLQRFVRSFLIHYRRTLGRKEGEKKRSKGQDEQIDCDRPGRGFLARGRGWGFGLAKLVFGRFWGVEASGVAWHVARVADDMSSCSQSHPSFILFFVLSQTWKVRIFRVQLNSYLRFLTFGYYRRVPK